MDAGRGKPLPRPDRDSAPFWDACRAHRLVVQRCARCASWRWPPRGWCPRCHARDATWVPIGNGGEVVSFVVCHRTGHPAFAADVPFVVADVGLEATDGSVVLSTNLIGWPWEEVRVGMAVEVVFDDVAAGVTLPKARPRTTRGRPGAPTAGGPFGPAR